MNDIINKLSFDKDGLIPAIIQSESTGDVLMMAYINKKSLLKTMATKETWFFSRSRQQLWHKGETSGHKQAVKQITFDCDYDTLLITVEPYGPACHTGETSCFYRTLLNETASIEHQIINQLTKRIRDRYENPVDGSYTTYLFQEGLDKILKKIGEEASEVIIAAKNNNNDEFIWEIADLVYHMLVLMELKNVNIAKVKNELVKRHIEKKGEKDE